MRPVVLLALGVWAATALTSSRTTTGSQPIREPGDAGLTTPGKLTVMVPMRDGTHLATDAWLPAGAGPWPVALERTPFGRIGAQADRYTQAGIVLVVQDVRGRGDSQGKARPFVDDGWGEHPDGADTLAWIRCQPWCNGKIATVGMPVTQLPLAGAGVKGIVGQFPGIAPISLYHFCFYQNGVFRKGWEGWLRDNWPPEVLPLFRRHSTYDEFWRGMDLRTRLQRVHWPMVHVAGWFDIFSQGTLEAFTELQERGGAGARGHQYLVVGPWTHFEVAGRAFSRKEGELEFPENAGFPAGASDPFDWISFWLKGRPSNPAAEPAVRYYVMGDVADPKAPGNLWRSTSRWPPPSRPLRLYFARDGGLTARRPAATATRGFDYDPTDPVPTIGGDEAFVPAGPRDQRRLETRPDVLVFSTPPLTEPLEVTGRIWVRLYAATSARDTDFVARLCDVYPDGRSILLTDGIVRARCRRSLARPTLVAPGKQYSYDIDLWSTSIIFNRGHRIRVSISSSNAPRFEPNPNTGSSWPPDPKEKPIVARQTIFLGGPPASHVILPRPSAR